MMGGYGCEHRRLYTRAGHGKSVKALVINYRLRSNGLYSDNYRHALSGYIGIDFSL
jgi:hypothetical protein